MILFVPQRVIRRGRSIVHAASLGVDMQGLSDDQFDAAAIADHLETVGGKSPSAKVQAVRKSQATPLTVVAETAVIDRQPAPPERRARTERKSEPVTHCARSTSWIRVIKTGSVSA